MPADYRREVQYERGRASRANPEEEYDGSYVENHCPDCSEYESECLCEEEET